MVLKSEVKIVVMYICRVLTRRRQRNENSEVGKRPNPKSPEFSDEGHNAEPSHEGIPREGDE